jgi:hypothetical protein
MRAGRRILVAALAVVLLGTASASRPEASVVGTIADESKAVLPGVTVTAIAVDFRIAEIVDGTQVVVGAIPKRLFLAP